MILRYIILLLIIIIPQRDFQVLKSNRLMHRHEYTRITIKLRDCMRESRERAESAEGENKKERENARERVRNTNNNIGVYVRV